MNPEAFDESQIRKLPVTAGSVVLFGSKLVHRSGNNLSGGDRRALLYSYQPAGRQASVDTIDWSRFDPRKPR